MPDDPAVSEEWAPVEEQARARTDPELLARLIRSGLDRGFAEELLPPSDHLFRIDPDAARRYSLRAEVLARCHKNREADQVLDRYVALFGHSAAVHLARAAIARARNLRGRTEEALWNALTLEPNDQRALSMWRELHVEGDRAALERVAALDGSWRARLALLQSDLSEGNTEPLQAFVRDTTGTPEATHGLSALLVEREQDALLVELLLDRYSPRIDGVATGVNLLQALVRGGRMEEGIDLLARIEGEAAGAFSRHLRIHAAALRMGEGADDERILRGLAAVARHDTEKNRIDFYRAIGASDFLLPLRLAYAPADAAADGIVEFEHYDSNGEPVLLAFSSMERVKSWDSSARVTLPFTARELLDHARASGRNVVFNAAGPAAMELHRAEVEAMLDGRVPSANERSEGAAFVFEPLRRDLPAQIRQTVLERLLMVGGFSAVRLVRLVEEKRGVILGVGLVPGHSVTARDLSSRISELNEKSSDPYSDLRRVRFFVPDSDELWAVIERIGTTLELPPDHALRLELK